MSSGIGAIYDEHREYLALCEEMGEEPVGGLPLASMSAWEKHWAQLKQKQAEHPHTAKCGYDRLASVNEDRYVCECGWREQAYRGSK